MNAADWYRLARSYLRHARLASTAGSARSPRQRASDLASRERWLRMACDARARARAARRVSEAASTEARP